MHMFIDRLDLRIGSDWDGIDMIMIKKDNSFAFCRSDWVLRKYKEEEQ